MKQAAYNPKNILKGVSTLDLIGKSLGIILLLLMTTTLNWGFNRGHSILDMVDPSFNPQITTTSFGLKAVSALEILPDGKILAAGKFNSYNRQPVGGLIRLNADGSLDTTFNNNVVETDKEYRGILVQPDGKIILYGDGGIRRFNSDGTIDSGFNSTATGISDAAIDANGRIIIASFRFSNGKHVLRLNQDGSLDSSFNFNTTANVMSLVRVATQNNKVIVFLPAVPTTELIRLNEDGSIDPTFTPLNRQNVAGRLIVQPDKRILFLDGISLQRLNENGDADSSFQTVSLPGSGDSSNAIRLGADGRITVGRNSSGFNFRRFLPSGEIDQSFSPFTHNGKFGSFALLPDGGVIIGDELASTDTYEGIGAPNWFACYTPNGTRDTSFNAGGIGFQTLLFGANQTYVRAVAAHSDGKILIGGLFDEVNGISRPKIARLNPDSTVDASFQINRSGEANYFSRFRELSNIRVQNDGKIIVTGTFEYVVNGAKKENLVRLNPDGSIDSTFNLGVHFNEWSYPSNSVGRINVALFNDGKLLVGNTRLNSPEPSAPTKLTAAGAVDSSFNSAFSPGLMVSIYDVAIQPDGKVLIGGRSGYPNGPDFKSFIVRLNADGSLDQTFQISQDIGKVVPAFTLLPNGKILVAKNNSYTNVSQSDVVRLNSNGSLDNSFNAGTSANGSINAIVTLANGDIFVGGRFTTFNGQPRQNLARLEADGSLQPTSYNVNEEVLSLEVDLEGRILVGGKFTIINAGGSNAERSNLARLIDSSQSNTRRTRFDFDGDGRSDLALFNKTNGMWSIRNSQNNQTGSTQFGLNTDKTAAADFDGDGKTDIAVFRPSGGNWYLLQSTAGFVGVQWGASGDIPVPADYDGDAKADIAVYRPSTGGWYILQSSNLQIAAFGFGLSTDIPLKDVDFDGDNKADIAVWRPSNGDFYWLASGSQYQFRAIHFGQTGDIPVAADYNVDGKTDLAVFRPSNGFWYQLLTKPDGTLEFQATQFGLDGDEPVAADYNGDGKTDIAVRRKNTWHFLMSGQSYISAAFGSGGEQAIAAPHNP